MNKFKSAWKKTHDTKKMDTAAAGPVPHSLLAEQDLETTKAERWITANGAHIKIDDTKMPAKPAESAKPFHGPKAGATYGSSDKEKLNGTINVHMQSSHMIMDNLPPEKFKENGGMPNLLNRTRTNIVMQLKDNGQQDMAQAVESIDTSKYSSLEEYESAVRAATGVQKSTIQQTGKQLDVAVEESKEVTDVSEKDDLIENIKHIQLKRQKAFIETRKSGGFIHNWKSNYYESQNY